MVDSGLASEVNEHQRLQLQFQLFQESLPKVDETVYRMLLNEAVPLAIGVERSLNHLEEDSTDQLETDLNSKLTFESQELGASHKLLQEYMTADQDQQIRINTRLENIGFQLGQKLSQLLIFSNNPNLSFKDMDLLSVMKFVCRDVWKQVFGKQIDNLKTNHRGTFYLLDYNYKPIESFTLEEDLSDQEQKMMEPFLHVPCGMIRGVLASLGFEKEDQVTCQATLVEAPDSKQAGASAFAKSVSFNVQVLVER
ncbi:LAQU0S07e01376g1_1 [Lachancea quebecensis]|uniref:LAQU0S07e01376g1_1 n=1 Tax=Lachancea quebecensis TaxID=1654605 RepID=A0A0P1KSV6_9SACH|nr:LAQU0S07e01376g1_1 [Lachancea quebecensis]